MKLKFIFLIVILIFLSFMVSADNSNKTESAYSIRIAREVFDKNDKIYYDFNDFELRYFEYLYVIDKNGNKIKNDVVKWEISDKKIIGIDENLLFIYNEMPIMALGFGEATVKATVYGVSDTIKITVPNVNKITIGRFVEKEEDDYVFISNDFELKKSFNELDVLDEKGNIINEDLIKWSSSDRKVVTFEDDWVANVHCQMFYPVGFGKSVITAELPNGVKDTIIITVPEYKKINIGRKIYNEKTGKYEYDFNDFVIKNADCEDLTVCDEKGDVIDNNLIKWSSSDKNIIELNDYGCITIMGFGEATITALLPNGIKDIIKITIPKPKKINIGKEIYNKKTDKYEYDFNDFVTVGDYLGYLKVCDETGELIDNNLIKWSSSNKNIITIDKEGNAKVVGLGEAIITAELNGVKDTVKITVPVPKEIYIGREVYNEETEEIYYDFNDFTIKENGIWLGAFDENDNMINSSLIKWSSSDKNIISFDKNGYVEIKGFGKVAVTAELNGAKNTVTITVPEPKKINIGIEIYNEETREKKYEFNDLTIKENEFLSKGKDISLVVFDENGNKIYRNLIKWFSSDKNIISFGKNKNSKITGFGEVSVTAVLPNGVSETVKLTVVANR